MYKYPLLLLLLCFAALPAGAQPSNYIRCDVSRVEDETRFERWLSSRKADAATGTEPTLYKIPVVVHLLHRGDPLGEGFNFPSDRVKTQIRTLNEDYRRKTGTPGFNTDPRGDDSHIEFILAQIDPQGNPTDGIDRIDMTNVQIGPQPNDVIQLCSAYSYWDPEQYLNIWSISLDETHPWYVLGHGRFPISDLDGLPKNETPELPSDGVQVDAFSFGYGTVNNNPNFDKGRTLAHEIGHFLGLLHTFSNTNQCDGYTDYCDDTPTLPVATGGCPSIKPNSCEGPPAMIENYMDGTYDACMNIFTKDQVSRMHTVLNNSPRRKSLVTSPVIDRSNDVTATEDDLALTTRVYPNPATDKLYLSFGDDITGLNVQIKAWSLLGKIVFETVYKVNGSPLEIPVSEMQEKMIILTASDQHSSFQKLIMINNAQ
jgi:hypothetical protein